MTSLSRRVDLGSMSEGVGRKSMSSTLQIISRGAVGALVKNIDLVKVTDYQLKQLRQAFAEHEV